MTYREICQQLENAGIENARWDAECLILHHTAMSRAALLSDTAKDFDAPALLDAVKRRCQREPLQYLLGEWEFYRQTYTVSPDCLIPRSDTEILVEEAIRRLPRGARFADLCTGSGCIAISVLAERPDTTAIALEKFPATLEIAKKNAERNGVLHRFSPICADVLCTPPTLPTLDAILSNPPYIETKVIDELSPEVRREPRAALDGGVDGLLFYRAILDTYTPLLAPDGFILFEIGYDQGEALVSLGKAHGFSCVEILRDLGGCDRVAYLSHLTERT